MKETRLTLKGILKALIMADNMGDVKDEIDHLHDLIGLDRPLEDFVQFEHCICAKAVCPVVRFEDFDTTRCCPLCGTLGEKADA